LWIHMALDRKAGRDNAFAYLARGKELRAGEPKTSR